MPDRLMRRGWEVKAQRLWQRVRRWRQLARMISPVLLLLAAAGIGYAYQVATGTRTSEAATIYSPAGSIEVVDDDTVRFRSERLRLLVVDAPEIHSPRCAAEYNSGLEARAELRRFISQGMVAVAYSGSRDVYGRPLVRLSVNGEDVGKHLLSRSLAIRYAYGKASKLYWCGLW